MQRDYSPFCHEGTNWIEKYVKLPSGVELLSVKFTPFEKADKPAILFIPGLVSIIENFRETLIKLTHNHVVYYVETREKGSARLSGPDDFSVGAITSDIVHYADMTFLKGTPWVMLGYSLGATIAAEAFSHLTARPEAVILIEPSATFPFSRGLRLLSRFAPCIYTPLKPLLKWYMRTFKIDIKEDLEMYRIYCRNIDAAIPERLGAAVRQLGPYRMNECLSGINVPTLVSVTSKDKLHNHVEGVEIANRIKGSTYLDMLDNKRSHSAVMGHEIEKFISSLARKPVQEDLPFQDTSSQLS